MGKVKLLLIFLGLVLAAGTGAYFHQKQNQAKPTVETQSANTSDNQKVEDLLKQSAKEVTDPSKSSVHPAKSPELIWRKKWIISAIRFLAKRHIVLIIITVSMAWDTVSWPSARMNYLNPWSCATICRAIGSDPPAMAACLWRTSLSTTKII